MFSLMSSAVRDEMLSSNNRSLEQMFVQTEKCIIKPNFDIHLI